MKEVMNKIKKNKALMGLLSAVFVLVLGIVLITVGKSLASGDSSILRNQTVDGLSFENAAISCESGVCTFTVDVYNENKSKYTLKNIDLDFKQSDNTVITLVGYIGEELESEEGRKLTASIDRNIEDSVGLEYKINK